MNNYINKLKKLFNSRTSQTITVQITHVEYDYDSREIEIGFRTQEDIQSKAVLDVSYDIESSEFIDFADSIDEFKNTRLETMINKKVEVNLKEFPQFYTDCKVPPDGLVVSAANHPDVMRQTEEFEESNPTMEQLLYERIKHLDGISNKEARKMANVEALNMGELDALQTNKNLN